MLISIALEKPRDRGIWAIGDTHGCAKTLAKLYSKISPRRAYMLGDYVDRGPDSKGVIDFIMARPNTIIPLMGNHEDMMLDAYAAPHSSAFIHWSENAGGLETLDSFGVTDIRKIPRKYITWLKRLSIVRRFGNTILSHAGANLNAPRPFALTEANRTWLMWNRKVKPPEDTSKIIVVGHTPVNLSKSKNSVVTRKVMIDGGCVYNGRLIAYNLDTKEIVSVKNCE